MCQLHRVQKDVQKPSEISTSRKQRRPFIHVENDFYMRTSVVALQMQQVFNFPRPNDRRGSYRIVTYQLQIE